ncbi:DUF6880 family protein [Desulfobulbus alkaliphilus]|uniref:DUF6880 family protein n=1 Tax=Desulfobulbus alkaliphilus TaxID=869814 RepID=UPI0019656262|nr:DUF6880 family protein [Desulfobulbus alkaliphilus]
MNRGKKKQIDPLAQAIAAALAPGKFISHATTWSFVDDVEDLAGDIAKIIDTEPERAALLFETFIAACHEKAEEIDDSSGNFGMLVERLFLDWIKSRQAAKHDPDETAKLLFTWMENDPHGFCYNLERQLVKVLDKKGLAALVGQIRARFESVPSRDEQRSPAYAHRKWGGVLKTLLAGKRDIEAYKALCEQTEFKPQDCLAIAKIYHNRRRRQDALAWVERGLAIASSDRRRSFDDHELRQMQRALLAKIGRPGDALQSAWAEYEAYPSIFTYKELMRYVPEQEKISWHQKAMQVSEKGDLTTQIELWLKMKEIDRLVSRLRKATRQELEDLSHFTAEPLAKKLKRSHPDISARVYCALCMRIINAGKSKYYDAALDNIKSAKKCYDKAGLNADWQAVVADVRQRHCRKKGFMAAFEDIVSGALRHV